MCIYFTADHTSMLGHTIEEIAWHKAGIFKTGCPAVTIDQCGKYQLLIIPAIPATNSTSNQVLATVNTSN